jgi:hypothetical protein
MASSESQRSTRFAVVLMVAVALAGSPPLAAAAEPASSAEAERKMADAEAAMRDGRYAEAAGLFAAAYRSLPAELRGGPVGASLVLHGADAYERAWLASDQLADLDAAIDLLESHGTAANRDEAVAREIDRVRTLRARVERTVPAATREPDGARDATRVATPPRVSRASGPTADVVRKHRRVGIALVTVGSIMSAAASVLGGFGPAYRRTVDSMGVTHFDSIVRPACLSNALTFGIAGPILLGFGTRDLLVAAKATESADRYAASRRAAAIALTTLGGTGILTGASLLLVGGVRWRQFDPTASNATESAANATLISEAGVAITIASIGVLAPGIAAFVAKDTPRFAVAPTGRGISITGRF